MSAANPRTEMLGKRTVSDNESFVTYAGGVAGGLARSCALEGCTGDVPWMDRRRRYCSLKCAQMALRSSNRRSQSRYRFNSPDKERCRQTLKNAILLGKVRRCARCERCGAVGPTEGHHVDYNKPFYVQWLCRSCHHKAGTAPGVNQRRLTIAQSSR